MRARLGNDCREDLMYKRRCCPLHGAALQGEETRTPRHSCCTSCRAHDVARSPHPVQCHVWPPPPWMGEALECGCAKGCSPSLPSLPAPAPATPRDSGMTTAPVIARYYCPSPSSEPSFSSNHAGHPQLPRCHYIQLSGVGITSRSPRVTSPNLSFHFCKTRQITFLLFLSVGAS